MRLIADEVLSWSEYSFPYGFSIEQDEAKFREENLHLLRYGYSPNVGWRLEFMGAVAEFYANSLMMSTESVVSVERAIEQRDAQAEPAAD